MDGLCHLVPAVGGSDAEGRGDHLYLVDAFGELLRVSFVDRFFGGPELYWWKSVLI